MTDDGEILDEEVLEKIMNLSGQESPVSINANVIEKLQSREKEAIHNIKNESKEVNQEYFVMEMDKLDHRADDLKISLDRQRNAIRLEIRTMRREYRSVQQLEEKVVLQRKIRNLEQKESKLRKEINELEDQIDTKKEVLIDEIEKRLDAQAEVKELFTIRWKII